MDLPGQWPRSSNLPPKSYICGYCERLTGVSVGFDSKPPWTSLIYLCGFCNQPTYFDAANKQYPAPKLGNPVNEAPQDLVLLYDEARKAASVGAYTAAVMCCRKLLMNIAVTEGAEEGKNYHFYVNYLEDNRYLPPNSKDWVDAIRLLGNEANHEIEPKNQTDALLAVTFAEMLLKFIYEFPAAASDLQ